MKAVYNKPRKQIDFNPGSIEAQNYLKKSGCGSWGHGLVMIFAVLAKWLDLDTSDDFYNLNISIIL